MQKPVVRDGVIKYVWSTGDAGAGRAGAWSTGDAGAGRAGAWSPGDARAGRVGAGGASTSTVNYEVDPEGSAGSCQGIRTFF